MKTLKSILAVIITVISVSAIAQNMQVDAKNSNIKWHGEKVTGEHFGTIKLESGNLEMKDNKIIGGVFLIDMSSIANTDVEDAEYKAKLEGHLKSDDFFGVETYPISKLEIKEATPFKDHKATVKAHLTIKATTLPIEFEVIEKDGKMSAQIVVDRSKYDVRYGSGSFFEGLGDKMIYDDFTLDVELSLVK